MDTENLDVVYVLGTGSKWNDNEIRFSLRSVQTNLKHKNVYLVGHIPPFIKNISHIPAVDITEHDKLRNTCHKLRVICENKDISEDFILMNDDFFVMKKVRFLKYYHKGSIYKSKNTHVTKGGYYYQAICDTIDVLKNLGIQKPLDYSVHIPIIFNKRKLLEVIKLIEEDGRQLLLRTIYCNWFGVNSYEKRDVKIKEINDLSDPYFLNSKFISTSDNIVHRAEFSKLIKSKFPNMSAFEFKIY